MSAASGTALRCWAEIDLAALERNLRLIRASLPPGVRYVAVVKADAYGHGLHQTVARLMHAGADLFAVANVAEAAAIRELGPGWPILLLGPVLPEEESALVECQLAASVSSVGELERLNRAGLAAGRPVSVHLKIDTGMGRLGAWHAEADALYTRLLECPGLRLEGIFTHFSAAEEDPEFTDLQRRRFLDVLGRLPGLRPERLFVHADNSAGLETFGAPTSYNAVRVGLLQFGILPHPNSLLARVRAEPVFSFHTRVGLVKRLPAGTDISYGRTHRLNRDSTIAVLTAGYADGLARACGNRGAVLLRGRRCPILGRVTMDQTVVDVTDVPGVHEGDQAILVGAQDGARIGIDEFSAWSDTIPYEVLCSITKRVPRLYRTSLGL